MKKLRAYTLPLLLLLISTPASALEITLQKSAVVNDRRVTLGDIAVFDEQSDTSRALAALVVSEAPEPGEHRFLRSVEVRNMLLRNGRVPAGTYWRGPASITVIRSGQEITAQQVLNEIAAFINDNRSDLPAAEIRFIADTLPVPFQVPKGELSCTVIPSSPGILRSTRFSLIYRVDDRVVRNMSVRGRIEALSDIVVARRGLRRGSELTRDDLTVVKKDIARMRSVVTDLDSIVGRRLTRALRAKTPLQPEFVEEIPVIHQGDPVKIIVRSGQMTLSATGIALVSGGPGATVAVENASSGKRLRARVEGPGVVSVQM